MKDLAKHIALAEDELEASLNALANYTDTADVTDSTSQHYLFLREDAWQWIQILTALKSLAAPTDAPKPPSIQPRHRKLQLDETE